MTADPLSGLALTVTVGAAVLYALYWTIRRAVADGLRDADHRRDGDDGPA